MVTMVYSTCRDSEKPTSALATGPPGRRQAGMLLIGVPASPALTGQAEITSELGGH